MLEKRRRAAAHAAAGRTPTQVERLRRVAAALGVEWPAASRWATSSARSTRCSPRDAALLEEAATLLRGAGYAAFDGDAARRRAGTREWARRTRT